MHYYIGLLDFGFICFIGSQNFLVISSNAASAPFFPLFFGCQVASLLCFPECSIENWKGGWVVSSNFLSNSFTFPSALSLWFKILILIIVIFLFYFFFFTILCQKFQVFIFISLSIVTVILQSVPNNCNIRSISLLISFFWLLLLFSLCFISYRSWLSLTVFWILYLKHFLWA